MLHVALAVSDAVEHIAARRGAKRVSLILADLELRAGHCVEELIEATFGKLAHLVLYTALDASDIGQHVRAELQMSPAHARMTPKSALKPSCAIDGAAAPAINMSATVNPAPVSRVLAEQSLDHIAIAPSCFPD